MIYSVGYNVRIKNGEKCFRRICISSWTCLLKWKLLEDKFGIFMLNNPFRHSKSYLTD